MERDFAVTQNQVAVGGRLVDVRTPRAEHEDLFVRLHGEHQGANAAIAIAAAEEFFDAALTEEVITEAFDTVTVDGRLQVVHRSPLVVVDAAHNVPGAEALAQAVEEEFGGGSRRFLVIGMQDGRDPVAVLTALDAASYEVVVVCTAPTARGVEAEALAEAAQAVGARCDVIADVEAALDHAVSLAADDDLVVVAGSTTVVGAALDARRGLVRRTGTGSTRSGPNGSTERGPGRASPADDRIGAIDLSIPRPLRADNLIRGKDRENSPTNSADEATEAPAASSTPS